MTGRMAKSSSRARPATVDAGYAVAKTAARLGPDQLRDLGVTAQLDQLSDRTLVEAIDTDPGSVVIAPDGHFEAAGTLYVTLAYDSDGKEALLAEGYPLLLLGQLDAQGGVTFDGARLSLPAVTS